MPTPFNIIFKIERNKKAYSRFVNALSRISKNYDFRFQIFCHIDLVLPFFFFFSFFFFFFSLRGQKEVGGCDLLFIQLQRTHSKEGNSKATMFIQCDDNKMIRSTTKPTNDLCAQRRLRYAQSGQSLGCPTDGS